MRPFTASLGPNGVNSWVTPRVAVNRLARPTIPAKLDFTLARGNRSRRGVGRLQSATQRHRRM